MKMKLFIPLLLVGMMAMSCVTMPTPESSEDTLGVFLLINETQSRATHDGDSIGGDYHFIISDTETDEEVVRVKMAKDKDYAFVKGLEPGEYYISGSYFRYTTGDIAGKHSIRKDYCQFTFV
ncbi:MAG: hypothetical protein PQJ60_04965, partial [Spirochaetales bacterium]|nr:hypothetical protein [Spirochaetales bacterium]